jgi:hypothetical protein
MRARRAAGLAVWNACCVERPLGQCAPFAWRRQAARFTRARLPLRFAQGATRWCRLRCSKTALIVCAWDCGFVRLRKPTSTKNGVLLQRTPTQHIKYRDEGAGTLMHTRAQHKIPRPALPAQAGGPLPGRGRSCRRGSEGPCPRRAAGVGASWPSGHYCWQWGAGGALI